MKAIIMAGGKGTRLRPLTCNKPKPMVPIANRPMMEHILNLLKEHGFNEVLITACFLPEQIENYFGDGSQYGLELKYLTEEVPLGTAGSVRNGAEFLTETFLVISGDALTDIDLRAAVESHRQRGATASLILTRVDNPLEYGVVICDQEGRIKRFLEKPGWGEVFSDTVNTGIYILEPKIFEYYQQGQEYDFSKHLFPQLLSAGEPLFGYVADGYWSDIGNLEQYRQAHYDVLSGKVRVSIPGCEIRTGVWVGEGVEIDPEAIITGPVLIGDHSCIKARAEITEFNVLGKHSLIQERVSLDRSILWGQVSVGADSEVRAAVLAGHSMLKGKNRVFEGAVLGERVILGTRANVGPGIKVWPDKEVDSGAVVNESLIWGRKGAKSLFGNLGISGAINQELTPEFVAKLGAVFGAYLKPGTQMVVGSDDSRAARVLKRALVSGVLAAGVGVYDLGTMTTALTRYALVALEAKGGVQLRTDPQESGELLLEFMDSQGMIIDKATERALENAFFSEDFPRATAKAMGELTFVPQLISSYLSGLVGPEEKALINAAHFKLVAVYDGGSCSLALPGLLDDLGCQVSQLDGNNLEGLSQARGIAELMAAIDRVGAAIRSNQADLGVIVDHNTERVFILDDRGELLKEDEANALLAFLVLKYRNGATLPVTVTAPNYIEAMAREFHGKVVRTKASPRSLMERVAQERLFPTADGRGSYQPQFDALFTLVKVLEVLAREQMSLTEIKALLPKIERNYSEAECGWESKGRVMRELFEENKERRLETIDGLKLYHDQGWALVLPDAEEPIFRIYAEANTAEEADALSNFYLGRINELKLT